MRQFLPAIVGVVAAMGMGACGPVSYLSAVGDARGVVEAAKVAGAEERAPYEVELATLYLAKAEEESAEAEYGRATEYAEAARDFAERARQRASHGPAGSPVDARKEP